MTTLDVVRASTFVSEVKGGNPLETEVTVVGGVCASFPHPPTRMQHSGVTILPLLSQTGTSFSQPEIEALTKRMPHA